MKYYPMFTESVAGVYKPLDENTTAIVTSMY